MHKGEEHAGLRRSSSQAHLAIRLRPLASRQSGIGIWYLFRKARNPHFQSSSKQAYTSGMFSTCSSSSSSGRASPEEIETFWGWYPEHIQMQLDEQFPIIANHLISDSPVDSDTDESSRSSLHEFIIHVHELLQTHLSNQEVPLLFDTASPLDYGELQKSPRELVIDPEDSALLDRESADGSNNPLNPFRDPMTFDDLLAMPTRINPQQGALRRWLEQTILPWLPASPLLTPEPIFDANFSSFLRSPTLPVTGDFQPIASEDCESDHSSTSSCEYEADRSGHDNYSEDDQSHSYVAQPIHASCHSHDDTFDGDPNCGYYCGSYCDFLHKTSKHERNSPCHSCCPSHEPSRGRTQARQVYPDDHDSMDAHLATLDLAERGLVFPDLHQPESRTSSYTAPEQWTSQSHYFAGWTQSQLEAFFRLSSPTSEPRSQPGEVDEPFLVWSGEDEDEDEDNLDLESDW